MALFDAATGLSAALASTGQQKALLLGVVLGHAALITAARGAPPLLLLDEPAVHLDPERRGDLLEALADGTAHGAPDAAPTRRVFRRSGSGLPRLSGAPAAEQRLHPSRAARPALSKRARSAYINGRSTSPLESPTACPTPPRRPPTRRQQR